MPTIDTLLLGTGVDLAGLTTGLVGAARAVQNFGSHINLSNSGADIASTLIASLEQTFTARRAELQASIASGVISPAQFATLAQQAAAQFTTGLQQGLSQFSAAGLVTDSMREQFESAMHLLGAQGGATLQAAIEQTTGSSSAAAGAAAAVAGANAQLATSAGAATGAIAGMGTGLRSVASAGGAAASAISEVQAASRQTAAAVADVGVTTQRTTQFLSANGDELTHLGRRGVEAIFGVSLALAAMAEDAGNATGKAEAALRTIAGFGLFLGSDGIIVSAAATALEAVISVIDAANTHMAASAAKFQQEIAAIAAQRDLNAVTDALQKLQPAMAAADSAIGNTSADMQHLGTTADAVREKASALHSVFASIEQFLSQGLGVENSTFDSAAKSITTAKTRLDALTDSVAHFQDLTKLGLGLTTAPTLNTGGNEPAKASIVGIDPTVVSQDVQKILTSFTALASAASLVNDRIKEIATPGLLPLTDQGIKAAEALNLGALPAFDRLRASIAAQHGEINANTIALAAMVKQFEQFSAVQILRIRVPEIEAITVPVTALVAKVDLPPSKLPPIDIGAQFNQQDFLALAQQLKALQAETDAASIAGNSGEAAALRQQQVEQTKLIAGFENDVLQHLRDMNAPASTVAATLATFRKSMQDAGIDAKSVESAIGNASFSSQLHQAATAVVALNTEFGQTATKAGEAIDAVALLVDQVSQLKTTFGEGATFAGLISGIAGIAGGIAGIGSVLGGLGSFFSSAPDPLQQEHDTILKQNTQALADLRASLNDAFGSGGAVAELELALRTDVNLNKINSILSGATGAGPLSGRFAATELSNELAKGQIDFADFLAEAKKLGITVLDSSGNLIKGSLEQFEVALDAAAASLLMFSTAFQDQVRIQEQINQAQGIQTPATDFAATEAAFSSEDKAAFDAFFGNLAGADFANLTKNQVAEFRADMAAFLTAIEKGKITLDELGGFADVNALDQAAGAWLDSLDAMAGAADNATQALLNVPTGFKLALAEFNATIPANVPLAPIGPIAPEPGIAVPTPTSAAFDQFWSTTATSGGMAITDASINKLADAIAGRAGLSGGDVIVGPDAIHIDAAGKNGAQLADEIVAQLRLKSRSGSSPLLGVLLPS